jgi:tight adherence protein C
MDKAGKAETSMMIPIVFLILPISVLFALWPSINQLSFFAS